MLNDKIIIALDYERVNEVMRLIDILGEEAVFYKIGISLFTKAGPEIVKELVNRKKRIFLDLKFFDIPNSMILASLAGIELGVSIINYHCLAGEASLRQVKEKVHEYCEKNNLKKPLLIGVTILTSKESDEKVTEDVIKLAGVAKNALIDGVVCSPLEIKEIKEKYGKDFKVIAPGIRMPENELEDQKRIATPRFAFEKGADYIVVGRPIIKAEDPYLAFRKIIKDAEGI